ncbi:MAG: hypothetical protein JEY71_13765 [Sphaerochaeta sp.]|nr:hypothetical protein [Sphaerochaeta sp.]
MADTGLIVISSISELEAWAEKIIQNFEEYIDLPASNLKFSVPAMQLKIYGEGYESSIDTPTMKAFLNIQKRINDVFSWAKYGYVSKLSQEELEAIALFVTVNPGCSLFNIDFSGIMEKLMARMNGLEITLVASLIIGAVAIFSINSQSTRYKLEELRQQAENKRLEIFTENNQVCFDKYIESMVKVFEDTQETNKQFYRNLSKASGTVEIDGIVYTKAELKTLGETPKKTEDLPVAVSVKGTFRVTALHFDDTGEGSTDIITLEEITTRQKFSKITVRKNNITKKQQEVLKAALAHEYAELELMVVYKSEKSDEVLNVSIVENEEPQLPLI